METVIVDSILKLGSVEHTEFVGKSDIKRLSAQKGSLPTDIPIYIVKLGASTRHVVIHDVLDVEWDAQRSPTEPVSGELYDVCVYNIGWKSTHTADRVQEFGGHGHPLYDQHYITSDWKVIDTSVFVAAFSTAGKIYGTNTEIRDGKGYLSPKNKIAKHRIRNSIFVGKFFLIGGEGGNAGAHEIYIDNCAYPDCTLRMGYEGQNGDGAITNSLLTNGLTVASGLPKIGGIRDANNKINSWRKLTVTGNTVVIPSGAKVNVELASREWVWDRNVYYSADEKPFRVVVHTGDPVQKISGLSIPLPAYETRNLTFKEWQELTGFDANSTFVQTIPEKPFYREYEVEGLEYPTRNVVQWSALGDGFNAPFDRTQTTEVAISGVYPAPPPLNWTTDIEPPLYDYPRVRVDRVAELPATEPDCSELEAELARSQQAVIRLTSERDALQTENVNLRERIAKAQANLNGEL